MSSNIKERAASAGVWFGAISLFTQLVSWLFTFYVIRLLNPQDYGLMTMAAFLTAYLQMFGGLGLGAAIVHREKISPGATSSVFWFSLGVGCLLALVAILLAHPTALLFKDDRLVPVTRLIAVLFVISALGVVPNSLLVRNLELRKVAMVNLVATLVSATLSVLMARAGWGVYTLICTNIILNLTKTLAFFVASRWLPSIHFDREEVMPYLRYGMYVAFSGTFQRLFQAVDKFIVGKFFGPAQLGIYDNAMTIASMPLDKIWPIYQQVVFPLFARLQRQGSEAYATCLGVLRHYLLLVSPIYLGAAVTAPEFIEVVLGDKWLGLIPWFRAFCLAKVCETLVAYHSTFYNATGRQKQVTRYSLIVLIAIPAAILPAASYSFEAVVVPWITVYPMLSIGWIAYGLRKNGFSVRQYALSVWQGMMGSLVMATVLIVAKTVIVSQWHMGPLPRLVILVGLGVAVFGLFLVSFQRKLVNEAIGVLTARRAAGAAA
jgi:O-antigen/teichoic acid export membrane protein